MDWDRRRFDDRRGEKVIDLLTDQVDLPHEGLMPGTGAHHLGIDPTYVPTHGCHLLEAMVAPEVAPLLVIDAVLEPLPSRAEAMGLVHTEDAVLLDDFHLAETTDQGLHLPHGAQSLPIVKVVREMYPGVAVAQGATGSHHQVARKRACPIEMFRSQARLVVIETPAPSRQRPSPTFLLAHQAPPIPQSAERQMQI
ncbi:uncharacterized protein N7483_011685 [Penicillium malachiteum]|uniref:uncharacterized protein n=1 Tax=Penicillium malachiteum TaxID=1324776 RepID=UPI002547E554|nr:uncharacterized protein N7483_011685 [Penicillium malachiteum]KAJ5714504.1 hypothetical protein N7483_011685 [Penicillium malachiteum]